MKTLYLYESRYFYTFSFHPGPGSITVALKVPSGSEVLDMRGCSESLLFVPVGAGVRLGFTAREAYRQFFLGQRLFGGEDATSRVG